MFEGAKKIKKKRLCVSISEETYNHINDIVSSKGLDKSKLVELILKNYITEYGKK